MPILTAMLIFFVLAYILITPLLAIKVNKRYEELGKNMVGNPYLSILNISFFWFGAYNKNKGIKDPLIRNYVAIYYSLLCALVLTLILMMMNAE